MLNGFTRPRVEGTFSGEQMRAWDTLWGHGTATVVIENSYANISESVITDGASEIRADGLFSLGYPRRDNGEEVNARIFITRRQLADLRHAFVLDEYPVTVWRRANTTCTASRDAVRVRAADHRQRHGIRRDVRHGVRRASLRGYGRAARRP